MRDYAYFYWIGVMIPTSLIVAMLAVPWMVYGQVGVANSASWLLFCIGLIAFFTAIGSLLRPLRPNRTEIAAFIVVGLIAAGFFIFWGIMAAGLVTGMLGD